jgi:hypothetical protein
MMKIERRPHEAVKARKEAEEKYFGTFLGEHGIPRRTT